MLVWFRRIATAVFRESPKEISELGFAQPRKPNKVLIVVVIKIMPLSGYRYIN